MRTIQLSHEEIERIKIALQYVYERKIDNIKENKNILGRKACDDILSKARLYLDTQDVFDGDRDV